MKSHSTAPDSEASFEGLELIRTEVPASLYRWQSWSVSQLGLRCKKNLIIPSFYKMIVKLVLYEELEAVLKRQVNKLKANLSLQKCECASHCSAHGDLNVYMAQLVEDWWNTLKAVCNRQWTEWPKWQDSPKFSSLRIWSSSKRIFAFMVWKFSVRWRRR